MLISSGISFATGRFFWALLVTSVCLKLEPISAVEQDTIELSHHSDKIYIDGIESHNYLNQAIDKQYPCILLTREYINTLKDKKQAFNKFRSDDEEDKRIRISIELDQLLISCAPFYSYLIDSTIEELGVLGRPIKTWMFAVEKYVKAIGNEGYALLIYEHDLRRDGRLMGFLRETLTNPDALDEESLGYMTSTTSDDQEQYEQLLMMRAYHAGDGLCNQVKNSPLSHLSYLLRSKIWADKKLNVSNIRKQEDLVLDVIKRNPLMKTRQDGSLEPLVVLMALDYICKDLKFYPTAEILEKIASVKPRGEMPVYTMRRSHDPSLNRIIIHRGFGRFMSHSHADTSSCSWLHLYKLKRAMQLKYDLGSFYDDLDPVIDLASNRFLEKCLTKLVLQVEEIDKLRMWPTKFPDNLVVENLVRRLESTLRSNYEHSGRMSDFIVRSGLSSFDEFGKAWLTYEDDFFHDAQDQLEKKLVESFANGADHAICQFYRKTLNLKDNQRKINWNLLKIVELIDSMFDVMKFRPNFSNDGLAFYYMWRFCWINSVLPLKLKPILTKYEPFVNTLPI